MSDITILDQITANSIAAGEVVERPASVVKELCENALDAGADVITIVIQNGGIRLIQVTDNGSGMDQRDAELAFLPHATSKLKIITDLDNLSTMGFRGEALSSISAVSRVTLRTRTASASTGTQVVIEGGEPRKLEPVGTPIGTTIRVEDLFFNTPARYKFLKKDTTEAGRVADVVEKLIIARPDVSFRLLNSDKQVLHSPGNNDLLSAIYSVFGKQSTGELLQLADSRTTASPIRLLGYLGTGESARKRRDRQIFYINDRVIKSPTLTTALESGYNTFLMKGRYPFAVLKLTIPPNLIDVNVHPQKTEVRFSNEREVFSAIHHAVRDTLTQHLGPRSGSSENEISPDGHSAASVSEIGDLTDKDSVIPHGTDRTLSDVETLSPGDAKMDAVSTVGVNIERADTKRLSTGQPLSSVTKSESSQSSDSSVANHQYFVMDSDLKTEGFAQGRIEENHLDGFVSETGRAGAQMRPLLEGKIAGQLFDTYILIESGEDYYLIDQHAAHEKINYEKLIKRYEKQTIPTQPLLVPLTVDVTAAELEYAESGRELLERFGFEYEPFGDRSLVIRAFPLSMEEVSPKTAFLNALDELAKLSVSEAKEPNLETVHQILATIACGASIKAHDKLSEPEIHALLKQMSELDNPFQCPHGRPSVIKKTRRDLEKTFKRIV
ncbi:MAG: DNA mismatch repair endonuclease MutL [Fastidiosipilaceae bacterium]